MRDDDDDDDGGENEMMAACQGTGEVTLPQGVSLSS